MDFTAVIYDRPVNEEFTDCVFLSNFNKYAKYRWTILFLIAVIEIMR